MPADNLKNVLVICPAYGSPDVHTAKMLIDLQRAGAEIILGKGVADVSLTRCVLAAEAEETLERREDLQWIFMLDADVSAAAPAVALLIEMAEALAVADDKPPSLCGLYLNRHRKPLSACAQFLRDAEPIPYGDAGAVFMPALTGLGCFLTPRTSFLAHCKESERMHWGKDRTIPVICESRPISGAELGQYIEVPETRDLYWQGEDFDYCTRELDAGRLVLVAPVTFIHHVVGTLDPLAGECQFPGFRAPGAASVEDG